jgi:EmrB/QacA subfamily drug resistance transporter
VLAIGSLGVVLAFIDATIVNIAFPDIREDFPETSLDGLSWILNAYNILFAAFLIAAGRIADLVGRRRMFSIGVFTFTLASVLCAISPSVEMLVASRALQAIGAAIVVPASLALVLEAYGPERRTHAITLWTANAVVAAGLGPSLGGLLVDLGGWRLAFLINLPVGLIALALAGRTMIESRAPGRRRMPDLLGALILAFGTGSLVLAIVKGGDWGWANAQVIGAFAAAAILLTLFAQRSTRHRAPLLDPTLLRSRALTIGNVLMLLGGAGFFAYTLCNVLFLTLVWEYSVLEAGLALTPGPFVAAAVARPAEGLAERLGFGPMIAVGGLFWGGGVIYLASAVGSTPDFVGEWLPGMAILGIGAGICFPLVGSVAVGNAPGELFATASALQNVSRQLGAALGVAILVAIVGTPAPGELEDAFDRGWLFAGGCFLALALGAPLVGRVIAGGVPVEDEPREAQVIRPPREAFRPHGLLRPEGPRPTTAIEALAATPLFSGLDRWTIESIASRAAPIALEAGELLFRQDDPPDSLYVLVAGRLEVLVGEDDDEVVNILHPGAVIGELGLLSGEGRSASIRARRDSRLLRLSAEEFDQLLHQESVSRALLGTLATQLQRSRARRVPGADVATTLAIVPAAPGEDFDRIASLLAQELREFGTLAVLDHAPGDPVAAIESAERDHDRVLLVARATDPADRWRSFCVREGDRVIAAAGPEAPTQPADHGLQGCELFWIRGASGTMAPWLDALAPRARYVLRPDDLHASVAAAARRLAGRSLGLVLSGGGARAFAHLGVLEELEAAGLAIDRVSGVSMGAFIGGMFAAGMTPAEVDARTYEGWVRANPLRDYAFPRHALIRGERVRQMVEAHLPGEIEELQREFACFATDLRAGEAHVFRRGSLARAVGPSLALPGIGPPQRVAGRLLVDGGLLNNLPLGLLDRGEGPIIACDAVAGGHKKTGSSQEPTTPSGDSAGNRTHRESRLPGIGETLVRSVLIGGVEATRAARRRADLLIAPDDVGVGMLEWHQIDAAKEAGRRAAYEALEESVGELP